MRKEQLAKSDSVWIPCVAVPGREPQDPVLTPVLVKDTKGRYFFPAFTSPAEMGNYAKRWSLAEKTLAEVMALALANDHKVAGIVLNAFTDPYELLVEEFGEILDQHSCF